jgi:hypothetical protein
VHSDFPNALYFTPPSIWSECTCNYSTWPSRSPLLFNLKVWKRLFLGGGRKGTKNFAVPECWRNKHVSTDTTANWTWQCYRLCVGLFVIETICLILKKMFKLSVAWNEVRPTLTVEINILARTLFEFYTLLLSDARSYHIYKPAAEGGPFLTDTVCTFLNISGCPSTVLISLCCLLPLSGFRACSLTASPHGNSAFRRLCFFTCERSLNVLEVASGSTWYGDRIRSLLPLPRNVTRCRWVCVSGRHTYAEIGIGVLINSVLFSLWGSYLLPMPSQLLWSWSSHLLPTE